MLEQIKIAPGEYYHPNDPYAATSRDTLKALCDAMTAANEGFVYGSYGTLIFDVTTGETKRYYHNGDTDPNAPEYADIVRIDVANYTNIDGTPFQPGECEDICYIGFWDDEGTYCAAETPPEPPSAFDIWRLKADREMKTQYAINLEDAGLSVSDLERYHAANPDPIAFVAWYGVKYDLDTLDPDYDPAREQRLADGDLTDDD